MHPTVPVTTIFPKMPELSKERRGVSNDGYDISVAQREHAEWGDAQRVQLNYSFRGGPGRAETQEG